MMALPKAPVSVKPNFSGSWVADVSRSKFHGPAPKSTTIVITHAGDDLHEDMRVTKPDDTEQGAQFKCSLTSGEARLNGSAIRCRMRWQNDELVIETWPMLGSRELHFCDYWTLSADGQILSMEHRGDDLAGQRIVFQRQS